MTIDYSNWWWTSTPYIDAYSHAEWVSSSKSSTDRERHLGISFEEFERKMRSQAVSWGEQGIGAAIATGREIPVTDDGKLVYAIGRWNDQYWVAAGNPSKDPYWWKVIEIEEYIWPDEWNVT